MEDTYKSLGTKLGLFACALGVLCPIGLLGTVTVSIARSSPPPVSEKACGGEFYTDPLSSGFFGSPDRPLELTPRQIEEALQAIRDPVFSDTDIPMVLLQEVATTVCNCQCPCQCACACACIAPGCACGVICNCDCNCGSCAAVCQCACSCVMGQCSCVCTCNCCGGRAPAHGDRVTGSPFRL